MEQGEIERVLVRVPGQGGNDLRTGDINTARAFLIFKDWEERERLLWFVRDGQAAQEHLIKANSRLVVSVAKK